MKRTTIITLIVLGVGALLFLVWPWSTYNTIIVKDETAKEKWADVQSSYQRRSDLIKNLLVIVESAADYEKETLTEVVDARSKATSINVTADNLTPENIQKFQAAQSQLSGALSRLLVTVERYPQLQATQAYRDFQVQLEGTENRINRARDLFNESVKNYNISIRTFPGNIVASFGSFEKKGSFEADKGTENAPNLKELMNKD